MYAITGASGNTGRMVAEKLLARGEKVRVIGRDAGRLSDLAKKGAEVFTADVADAAALTKAFDGARGVYAMVPPNNSAQDPRGFQERVTDAFTSAIQKAGVGQVVALSSIGADQNEKTGPVVGLHNLEQKFNAISGLKALYLRAGYFMENLLPQIDVIQMFGIVGGPLRADLQLPMIAARDIGAAAAGELLKSDSDGKKTRELLGERNLTYDEVATVLGKAIGKPGLAYAQLPPQQLKPALQQMGMSANLADLLLEMSEAMNSGQMAPREPRSARNTTPTSIETFVEEEFLPRYQGKSVGA